MRRALAIAVMAIAVAGCGGGSDEQPVPKPTDREVIRGWIAALNASDYVAAASYFAKDAIVEQTDELRLHTRDEAEGFNQSLPCRADLTDTEDEGKTTLAAFRLRAGPGGPCHGSVRVRFTIKNGKFTEWRQLPEAEPGNSV
jgi:ketosteroid isomerase-like protein